MNELKPCPFCGSNRILVEYLYFRPYILCEKCHAQIPCYNTYPKAKEAWNRRDENVAPVVNGRWVTHYQSGTPVAEGYVSTCCDMWNNRKSDHCPHCGATMDIEDGGDNDAKFM